MMLFLKLLPLFGVIGCVRSSDFDHFVFAQEWPLSMCIGNNMTTPHPHDCKINRNVTGWVIHGLWPTENATHGPFFCNNSSHFNLSSLNPIIGDLLEFWTNLYAEKSAKSFWEHEWYKHGTCATSVSKFNNEYHYFKGTLDLHTKFNLTRFLEERGILPSSVHDYQYTDLLKALQKKTVLSCYHDKTTRVQFLSSIEICLSKSLQWIDCPSSTATMTRKEMMNYRIVHAHPCSDIVPIMYPRMNRV